MLSILIPIYNYNAYPLVLELHKQCANCGINFEIIAIDDASTEMELGIDPANGLSNFTFIPLVKNIGRSKIRNLLVSKAKYDWILFMDCDTFPESPYYIANYIREITESSKSVIYGGLKYRHDNPPKDQYLRWIYGSKREAVPLSTRIKNPYKSSLVSNIVIKKQIFKTVTFDETILEYGYEDFAFFKSLQIHKIEVCQIENPVYHLNLETSEIFLSKTRAALQTLAKIRNESAVATNESKIVKTYEFLCSWKLNKFVASFFQMKKFKLEKNLTSDKPSLFAFDCYKIGYFCLLNRK